ncbi:MAG: hypothetical protein ACYSWW_09370 [Planctomycetota bacterium]|jgi:hypothetical protein
MPEYSKINFNHRKEISDCSDLVEMLFPGNRNQQYAAICILFELKWSGPILRDLAFIEQKHGVSRRILQRTRAKLTRFGLIEHISSFNSRYEGRAGWRLSTRFEAALRRLADKYTLFRNRKLFPKDKDSMFVSFSSARRYSCEASY